MREKDKLLISLLRENARESLTSMSKKTGIPISTLFDRLKLNEKSIIKRHVSLINFEKLGYGTTATILIKARSATKEKLLSYLKVHPNVNSVYRINNGYDFLIEVVFKNIRELQNFIDYLETEFKISGKKVNFIIEEVKKERFMTGII